MAQNKKMLRKKKVIKKSTIGNVYIQATFNNTIVTITDDKGNCLSWSSAGSLGFKGARKSTPHAAQLVCQAALDKVKDYGLESVNVNVSGIGTGRESAVRNLGNNNLSILSIQDTTSVPHNGCRPKKVRRV